MNQPAAPVVYLIDGQLAEKWATTRDIATPRMGTEHVMRAALLTLLAIAGAAIGLILAPAGAASASSSSAIATIGELEAQGYDVMVDRIGSAPLSECEVTSVRNPQEQTSLVRVNRRNGHDDFVQVVVNRSIAVSLDCSGR
jgi:hypothetical protein